MSSFTISDRIINFIPYSERNIFFKQIEECTQAYIYHDLKDYNKSVAVIIASYILTRKAPVNMIKLAIKKYKSLVEVYDNTFGLLENKELFFCELGFKYETDGTFLARISVEYGSIEEIPVFKFKNK
jgi:hypothetical protein